MEFNCIELVELKDGNIYFVTGVIHDTERLFVTGINETKEKEVKFSEVVTIWRKESEQLLQPDNLPEEGDSDYWDDHGTGK